MDTAAHTLTADLLSRLDITMLGRHDAIELQARKTSLSLEPPTRQPGPA